MRWWWLGIFQDTLKNGLYFAFDSQINGFCPKHCVFGWKSKLTTTWVRSCGMFSRYRKIASFIVSCCHGYLPLAPTYPPRSNDYFSFTRGTLGNTTEGPVVCGHLDDFIFLLVDHPPTIITKTFASSEPHFAPIPKLTNETPSFRIPLERVSLNT